jgi:MoaA/NifB/PqqE/SkfB family radical SAM enzyme
MLTQQRADELMAMEKYCVDSTSIQFPGSGMATQIEVKSTDDRESFLIDVNRRGRIRMGKCTYQERFAIVEILFRLDVGGPPHENPDGNVIPCPHLHVYREGFGTKWAYALPGSFTNPTNLVNTFIEFLVYCNVKDFPQIQRSLT